MNALEWLTQFPIFSRERMAMASKSEMRRWFDAGNVWLDGKRASWNEEMRFPLTSVVLFPKGKRITLL